MKETIYYLISNRLVGRKEGEDFRIFRNDAWIPDTESIIKDHLMGYDSGEPDGSPYGIGNLSIMDEIEEITREQAMELIGGRI